MSKFILILLAVISKRFSPKDNPCSGRTGICINIVTCSNYEGMTFSGKCPSDPDNIKCCDNMPCTADDGRRGSCIFTDQCKGNTVSGKCPGGSNFKCCLGFFVSLIGASSINTYFAPYKIKSSLPEINNSIPKIEFSIQNLKSETEKDINFESEIQNFKGTSKLEIESSLLFNREFITSKIESTNLKVSSSINILGSTISELHYTNRSDNITYYNNCLSHNEGPPFNESENKIYITSSEFKEQIMKNISAFIKEENSSKIVNGSDFIALILSSDNMNTKEQIDKGISAIDLGNCTNVIKEHYNISQNESFYVLNIESKKNESEKSEEKIDNTFNLGKEVQIEIYDKLGNKLDLSICKQDIKVMKYIGDVKELNIDSAMSFSEQGIDIFNANDDFFNDICQDFGNINGKDIIINDRRNDIYQNAKFCQKGCSYSGIDYEIMAANCICNSSKLQITSDNNSTNNENKNNEEEIVSFKSLSKSIIANLFDFNIDVIKCYKLVFNIKKLYKNIGFYCTVVMFILQIIFLIVYLLKRLKPLKLYMLLFNSHNPKAINSFPPLKIKKKIKSNSVASKKKNKLYKIKSNEKIPYQYVRNKNTRNTKKSDSLYNLETKEEKYKNSIKLKKNKDLIKLSKDDDILQNIVYEQAILYDKRPFLRMYWSFLINAQIILETFCKEDYLKLFIIKLSFLIFTFQISFFLNAFFYTDEYISNAYHNNGILDFFSGLPKSIYSLMATMVITNLLNMLSNSKTELSLVIRKKRENINKLYINMILRKLRNKLIIYFILVFILGAFFLYYVCAFCSVYHYSQKYWFFGSVESFGMDFLLTFIFCIFLAFFRYLSIKKHIKCFYILANIISNIL